MRILQRRRMNIINLSVNPANTDQQRFECHASPCVAALQISVREFLASQDLRLGGA